MITHLEKSILHHAGVAIERTVLLNGSISHEYSLNGRDAGLISDVKDEPQALQLIQQTIDIKLATQPPVAIAA